jgi:hypothetical protein
MLYDPKWDGKTEQKADPFSLASLIAWLEHQASHTSYSYAEPQDCLLCRYFIAMGFNDVGVNPAVVHWNDFEDERPLPQGWDRLALSAPWTYGAALKRARALASRS